MHELLINQIAITLLIMHIVFPVTVRPSVRLELRCTLTKLTLYVIVYIYVNNEI